MNRYWAVGLLSVGIMVGSTPAILAVREGASFKMSSKNERVNKLFREMRSHRLNTVEFPNLAWNDIDALMKVAESTEELKCFPINALSSQAQPQCSEGVVALWLIEGIRKGGKRMPSLNPLLGPLGSGRDWERASEVHHAKALEAYRSWWKLVKSLPTDQAAKVDPLEGTGVAWFGSAH